MTISSNSREKERKSIAKHLLDETQVDTVPNPKTQRLSLETRYGEILILCDINSCIFRLTENRDKTTEACIVGIPFLTSSIPTKEKRIRSI